MNEAEGCHDFIHNLAGGAASALFVGLANARAAQDRRQAHEARCTEAAAAARGAVLSDTVFSLRERLADAEEDVAILTNERDELERKLAILTTAYCRLRTEGRVAV